MELGRRSITAAQAIVAALIASLAACATEQPATVEGVKAAEQSDVASCTYVDNVTGSSGLYGAFAAQGLTNARVSALQQAKKIGATHVVWIPTDQGYGSSQVQGKAYRCN